MLVGEGDGEADEDGGRREGGFDAVDDEGDGEAVEDGGRGSGEMASTRSS